MIAIPKKVYDVDLENEAMIEIVWSCYGKDIPKRPKVLGKRMEYHLIEHPRMSLDDAKNYSLIYYAQQKYGVTGRKANKVLNERERSRGSRKRYKKLADSELQDAFNDIDRINEKIARLDADARKAHDAGDERSAERYEMYSEYMRQYRKTVRKGGSRLKDRMIKFDKKIARIDKHEREEFKYLRRTKEIVKKGTRKAKEITFKLLTTTSTGGLTMSPAIADPDKAVPFAFLSMLTTTAAYMLTDIAITRSFWSEEDKAAYKYEDLYEKAERSLAMQKAKIYVQTSLKVVNQMGDILGIDVDKKTFEKLQKEAEKI